MTDEAYREPPWLVRKVFNPLVMRLGMATTLVVPGRKTGELRSTPVNVLEHGDARYLIAPRGTTQWVKNLRAAGKAQLRRKGAVEDVRAEEVAVEERPPLIAAYRKRWDRQVKREFEALPDPADHPVFRLEAA